MPDLPDLLSAARRGDEAAWRMLVERYDRVPRSAARAFRLDAVDADDIAQSTWLSLLEQGVRLRDADALGGWLATTARRLCMRLASARLREEACDPADLPDAPVELWLEDGVDAAARRSAVRSALAGMTERQRAVVTLLAQEPPPSYATVAVELNLPVGSIGPTRGRCIEQLRRHGAVAPHLDPAA